MSATVTRLTKAEPTRRRLKYPALASLGVHLVITPFLLWLVATANPPENGPGKIATRVESAEPLDEEIQPPEPPPPLPLEEPVPAELAEEEPLEEPVFREMDALPPPDLTASIALDVPSQRYCQKPRVPRCRPEPAAPPPPVQASVPRRRPAGPTRTAAPREGNPPPAYPRTASTRGFEGTVLLCVKVSRRGTVAEITLLESSGHDSLDEAAIAAVKEWKFRPALRAGVPVPAVIEVPIYFELRSR